VESEPGPPAVDPHLTPEQALLLQADLRRLQDAIAKVPLRLRAVLLLHDFDEVPVAEAAAALGIPVKTAYSRLAAARKRFRQAFRQAELGPLASPAGDEP
jgi:RNA polymerase sigma-70 factor (ECF subfamily)